MQKERLTRSVRRVAGRYGPVARATPGFGREGATASLTWTSVANRFYHIDETPALGTGAWTENALGLISPDGWSTTRTFSDALATNRCYRIRVSLPLGP